MIRYGVEHMRFLVEQIEQLDQASQFAPTWSAVISEAFHLLGQRGAPGLGAFFDARLSWSPSTLPGT